MRRCAGSVSIRRSSGSRPRCGSCASSCSHGRPERGSCSLPAVVASGRVRFREQVWTKAVTAAARAERERTGAADSVFDGFTFHMLHHTAGSLMALADMDPAVAAERMGHSDGGALFPRTYRHLYESEMRAQALRLQALLDGTRAPELDREEQGGRQTAFLHMGAPGIEPGTSRV